MFLRSALFSHRQATGIFSRRQGGCSPKPFDSLNLGLGLGDDEHHIERNLHTLCQEAQLPLPHRSIQVHGTSSLFCSGEGLQHDSEADILISNTPHTALAVRTADCLPVLLLDTQHGIAVAVHAGWRGTAQCIVQHAINEMMELGASPEYIQVSMGPCIQRCCFEVDAHTAEQLSQSHPQTEQHIHEKDERFYPDLQAINHLQLLAMGVPHTSIECLPHCTCCRSDDFFSWRRDKENSGRMLAIVITPAPASDLL